MSLYTLQANTVSALSFALFYESANYWGSKREFTMPWIQCPATDITGTPALSGHGQSPASLAWSFSNLTLEKALGQEEENMSSTPGLISSTLGLNFFTYKIVMRIIFPQSKKCFWKSKKLCKLKYWYQAGMAHLKSDQFSWIKCRKNRYNFIL